MCGRYLIDDDNEDIKNIILQTENASLIKSGEIFPGNFAPVISKSKISAMKWGFKGFDNKSVIINARSESVEQKTIFKHASAEYRCIIPASCYFEWRKEDGKKDKYIISSLDKKIIYMAGLIQNDEAEKITRFVILTSQASDKISFIHNRMPVILSKKEAKSWLQGHVCEDIFRQREMDLAYMAVQN